MAHWFTRLSSRVAAVTGHYLAFVVALGIVIVWAASGPLFGFSDTWQLVINTGTTIVTFLMVFLIQNTQNRDTKAIHLKLDELIHSIADADNEIISAEDDSDEELEILKREYATLTKQHNELKDRLSQTNHREPKLAGSGSDRG